MILVDTNVLFHAFVENSPHHESCRRWLAALRSRRDPWCITWPIVYEFLRITTHRGMLERPFRATEAWGVVSLLLESRELDVLSATSNHARVAGSTLAESPEASGNVMHDIHTLILMREHGVRRIATRDKDFRRFRGIEAVDPVQAD